jgi:hypothetical protein
MAELEEEKPEQKGSRTGTGIPGKLIKKVNEGKMK